MKVYKIECEWDMGFEELYPTKEAAEKALLEIDWELELEDSLDALMADGLVCIKEIEV